MHIMVNCALAGQPEFSQIPLFFQLGSFCFGHSLWLSGKKFYPAGCALGISTATVERLPPIIFQGEYQAGSSLNFKFSYSFNF
jgi:hypothetical protein